MDQEAIAIAARMQRTYKFMYLLRDLGIKSAHASAVLSWAKFAGIIANLAIEEENCSNGGGYTYSELQEMCRQHDSE